MIDSFIKITYENRPYIIYKGDSLKTLLTHTELLTLPLSIWKTLLERKDGVCFYNTLYKVLEAEIKYYDTSSNVNGFYYDGKEYWYSKDTRVGLQNLVNSSTEDITLVLGDNFVELSADKAKQFLQKLEVYAGKCYINTKKHLQAIKNLKTVDDLINYDYTTGYPSKITLEI